MKNYFLFLVVPLIVLFAGCGTLGSFKVMNFSVDKHQLSLAIDTIFKNYPNYKIPEKWKYLDSWDERGYGFLDSRIFYFKDSPEEMYYVTFRGGKTASLNTLASISIRAVSSGKGKWLVQDDLNDKECERIELRFESEILSKIKYNYYKSD